jgi:putative chitinase
MNPIQLLQDRLELKPDGQIGAKTFGALRAKWELNGIQLCHFLGQCEHETGGFRLWEENLNYSENGLLTIFPRHYKDPLLALKHQRKPSVIANHVYGNRMGNNQPNDGWHFRGRGAIQLTGRTNYRLFAEWLKDQSIMTNPDQVATKYAFESALWYFTERNIFRLCTDLSADTITKVTRLVNGGTNGLEDRIKKTLNYQQFL